MAQRALRSLLAFQLLLAGCGGGNTPTRPPPTPEPAPLPSPTPEPGSIRLLSESLAVGSVVEVAPMFGTGQQAPQLRFRVAVRVERALSGTLVRAWVRNAGGRCMGGGLARVDFEAGVEQELEPGSMSNPGSGQPLCALPYSTTHVEVEVFDGTSSRQLLSQQFARGYQFVAAP